MKRIFVIAAALFSFGIFASAEAVRSEATNVGTEVSYQTDKVKISKDELPQAVKDSLKLNYKEWQVGEIYKVNGTNEYYSIELKNGTETKTVNLDKDGKEAKLEAKMD